MPDYASLRNLVSHRVLLEYDSGTRIEGYVATAKPARGDVQVMRLSKATVRGADGKVLGTHEQLTVVPNLMVASEGDAKAGKVVLEFDSGAKIVGQAASNGAAAGLQQLTGATIHDAHGRVLERHERLLLVARPLLRLRLAEGPGGF